MLINPEEKRDLKKANKRLLIFLLLIFAFDAFIAFLFFEYTNMHSVLCGFIIIVITGIFYAFFMWLCSKIDKRRERKRIESGKKDPFAKEEKPDEKK